VTESNQFHQTDINPYRRSTLQIDTFDYR